MDTFKTRLGRFQRRFFKKKFISSFVKVLSSSEKKASLTLVSVGPGDPALMTFAAIQAIQNSTLVAYPIAKRGGQGLALSIASFWIPENKQKLALYFPMVSDALQLKRAWQEAGAALAAAVNNGERVVFLCQGDSTLFASSSYVLLEIEANHPDCPVKIIPGVTAVSAAAAAGLLPLPMQDEQLLIRPTPDSSAEFKEALIAGASSNQVTAFLKLGERWLWVKPVLEEMGLLDAALFAERIGFFDQKIMKAREVDIAPKQYFSLLIVRHHWPSIRP